MLDILILICLLGGLVWFLLRRKTPRAIFSGAVFFSIIVFFLGYWMVRGVLDQYSPDLESGVVPYLIAVAPVVGFLSWFLKDPQARKK